MDIEIIKFIVYMVLAPISVGTLLWRISSFQSEIRHETRILKEETKTFKEELKIHRQEIRKSDDRWEALLKEVRDNREEMRIALKNNHRPFPLRDS